MRSIGATALLALTLLPAAAAPQGAEEDQGYAGTPRELVPYRRSAAPYRRFFVDPPVWRGPGRHEEAPAGLETVRIGLLAPLVGGQDAWAGQELERGVTLAIEEANAAGGLGGIPFELVPRNDDALWGSSANTLAELAYDQGVWAVIGSIDSTSTHVALRLALKAEVVIVNVGSSDPTVTETGIPWIVRCTPDDRQTSYRLARLLFEERGFSRVGVLRSSDRYGRFGIKEFRDAARRLMRPLPAEILFDPAREDFGPQLDQLAAGDVEAVVLWARAPQAAAIAVQMRERGLDLPLFGTDRLVSETFLEGAGAAAEGAVATAWTWPSDDAVGWRAFEERHRERFGVAAGIVAAYGYDATRLLLDAIGKAGLNRVRIRDALAEVRAYEGVTGTIRLDATSNNVSPLALVRVEEGRFVPY